MAKESLLRRFHSEMRRQGMLAEQRGQEMDLTLNYGGVTWTVTGISAYIEHPMWKLDCEDPAGNRHIIMCGALAFPICFSFRDKKEAGAERKIGFQIEEIDQD